jgi:hypothetical protein
MTLIETLSAANPQIAVAPQGTNFGHSRMQAELMQKHYSRPRGVFTFDRLPLSRKKSFFLRKIIDYVTSMPGTVLVRRGRVQTFSLFPLAESDPKGETSECRETRGRRISPELPRLAAV